MVGNARAWECNIKSKNHGEWVDAKEFKLIKVKSFASRHNLNNNNIHNASSTQKV